MPEKIKQWGHYVFVLFLCLIFFLSSKTLLRVTHTFSLISDF